MTYKGIFLKTEDCEGDNLIFG